MYNSKFFLFHTSLTTKNEIQTETKQTNTTPYVSKYLKMIWKTMNTTSIFKRLFICTYIQMYNQEFRMLENVGYIQHCVSFTLLLLKNMSGLFMILLKRKFLNLAIRKIASYVNTNTHLMFFFCVVSLVHQMKFAPPFRFVVFIFRYYHIYDEASMLMVGKYKTVILYTRFAVYPFIYLKVRLNYKIHKLWHIKPWMVTIFFLVPDSYSLLYTTVVDIIKMWNIKKQSKKVIISNNINQPLSVCRHLIISAYVRVDDWMFQMFACSKLNYV